MENQTYAEMAYFSLATMLAKWVEVLTTLLAHDSSIAVKYQCPICLSIFQYVLNVLF